MVKSDSATGVGHMESDARRKDVVPFKEAGGLEMLTRGVAQGPDDVCRVFTRFAEKEMPLTFGRDISYGRFIGYCLPQCARRYA